MGIYSIWNEKNTDYLLYPFYYLSCIFFVFSLVYWERVLLWERYLDLLMESFKAFIFKERSLRSLIWFWGIFGTILLFLLVDVLATIPLIKRADLVWNLWLCLQMDRLMKIFHIIIMWIFVMIYIFLKDWFPYRTGHLFLLSP